MAEKFDAIVVGAGPAGNAAAYTMAKAGLSVLQLERGNPWHQKRPGGHSLRRRAGAHHSRFPRRCSAGAPRHRTAHVGAG